MDTLGDARNPRPGPRDAMNILVTYAVDPEFAPWQKLRKFQKIAAGEFAIQRTEIGGATVDLIVSGMGPERAARAMAAAASRDYAACIASGFAGALTPALDVSEVVAAKFARQAGSEASVPADTALLAQAVSAGAKSIEALVSSERVATNAAEKAALATSGDAVDMESFTVLTAARERGIPGVAIRVISDRHDQAIPVDLSKAVDEHGQVSIGAVLRMVAGNPSQISGLMRLGRESKAAAEVLARFLDSFVEGLASAAVSSNSVPIAGAARRGA
jgi:nucleoside phosphorylase